MTRTPIDHAIEFGRYLANAAEDFMREQNRAAETGETIDAEAWNALESAVYEFRKRADRADVPDPHAAIGSKSTSEDCPVTTQFPPTTLATCIAYPINGCLHPQLCRMGCAGTPTDQHLVRPLHTDPIPARWTSQVVVQAPVPAPQSPAQPATAVPGTDGAGRHGAASETSHKALVERLRIKGRGMPMFDRRGGGQGIILGDPDWIAAADEIERLQAIADAAREWADALQARRGSVLSHRSGRLQEAEAALFKAVRGGVSDTGGAILREILARPSRFQTYPPVGERGIWMATLRLALGHLDLNAPIRPYSYIGRGTTEQAAIAHLVTLEAADTWRSENAKTNMADQPTPIL